MDWEVFFTPGVFYTTVVVIAILVVNGFAVYLWYRLNTLIHETSAELRAFVGDDVARLYTRYLFSQITAGRYSLGPRLVASGNPETSRIIQAVKGTSEFARIRVLASCIRGLPINFVGLIT